MNRRAAYMHINYRQTLAEKPYNIDFLPPCSESHCLSNLWRSKAAFTAMYKLAKDKGDGKFGLFVHVGWSLYFSLSVYFFLSNCVLS